MTDHDAAEGGEPTAWIVVGPAGSGKSTVARRLARAARAVYLDKDAIAGPLVEVALALAGEDPGAREGSRLYRDDIMPAEYLTVFSAAAGALSSGISVVIDAPFAAYLDDPNYLTRATRETHWPASRSIVVRVRASEVSVRERLIARGYARDHVKLGDWEKYWATWGTTECAWSGVQMLDFDNEDDDSGTTDVRRLLTG